jgi:hypothetical protein
MSSRNFFAELERRDVYKVAVAYAASPGCSFRRLRFSCPQWAMQIVIFILLVAFPIAPAAQFKSAAASK